MNSKLMAAVGFLILIATAFQNCAEDFNTGLEDLKQTHLSSEQPLSELPETSNPLGCEGSACPDPSLLEACMFNGKAILPGEDVIAYEKSSVPFGSSCRSQLRFCGAAGLTGSYQYASCEVGAALSCLHNGITVGHNESIGAYAKSTVPYGQTCNKVTLKCSNGSFSPNPVATPYTSCSVGGPADCAYNGGTLAHGKSITAYTKSSVPYGEQCPVQTVSCNNGSLTNGSAIYASCKANAPIVRWVNASEGETHSQTCHRVGLFPSKNKGYGICASGEGRPQVGTDYEKISYRYGTYGSNPKHGGNLIVAGYRNYFCYGTGQKQDSDSTDALVAYLCSQEPNTEDTTPPLIPFPKYDPMNGP